MKITTNQLIKVAVISALFTQISHASYLFYKVSHEENDLVNLIFSYIFAISLELSIYIFTMKGKKKVATFFATISVMVNLLYYFYAMGFTQQFLGMVVISLIVPITIWFYSDLIQEENLVEEPDFDNLPVIDFPLEFQVKEGTIKEPTIVIDENGNKKIKRPVGKPSKKNRELEKTLLKGK